MCSVRGDLTRQNSSAGDKSNVKKRSGILVKTMVSHVVMVYVLSSQHSRSHTAIEQPNSPVEGSRGRPVFDQCSRLERFTDLSTVRTLLELE